ncbi:MAG: Crp/Fnr family transcriptional regulator [Pseudomonadota bacterium]
MHSYSSSDPEVSGHLDETLPAAIFDEFVARSTQRHVPNREIVIVEGSTTRDVFVIRSGTMQVVLSSSSGREVILRQIGPGHLFGEMAAIDGAARSARILALSDCTVNMMSGEKFLQFLSDVPAASLWLMQQMTARVRDLTEKTYAFALLPVPTRIHAEILRLAQRSAQFDDGLETVEIVDFPTHADIAARVGTHREGVSRELSLLTKEGLIEQVGRRLTIRSLTKLRSIYERVGQ